MIARGVFDEDEDALNLMVSQRETGEAERVAEEIMKLTGYGELIKQRGQG